MSTTRTQYETPSAAVTELVSGEGAIWLSRLHGLSCGRYGDDPVKALGFGLFLLETDEGVLEQSSFTLEESRLEEGRIELTFEHSGLELRSRWHLDPGTGTWSRQDGIKNRGTRAVRIRRAASRFVLSPGRYELFSQDNRWCWENQGSWLPLANGSKELSCEGARTCQGSNPILGVRPAGGGPGLLFHLVPRYAWQLRATAVAGSLDDPALVVDAGPACGDLSYLLEPGASWELPEILIQELAAGREESAAPALHRYALDTVLLAQRPAPLVYNSWLDVYDRLDPERLARQLEAAASLGFEVFMVDAGWFGGTDQIWAELVGDWREKKNAAFRGNMREFGSRVRKAGLGFGIWVEPERIRPLAPIFQEHPEWFIPGSPAGVQPTDYYPDLSNPAVYSYTLTELCRLMESYECAYVKIDYNHSPALDPSRRGFAAYYERWYALLDELRKRNPGLFVEACASGGMRAELAALGHADCHALTDSADPLEELRIGQGALLRLPPGRVSRWAVLRSLGRCLIRYGSTLEESPETIVAPSGATWEPAVSWSMRFIWAVNAAGLLAVSGDLAGLGAAPRAELAGYLAASKSVRGTISRAHAHLLTPPGLKTDSSGWAGIQLSAPRSASTPPKPEEHVLFAYRLNDGSERRRFALEGLEPGRRYEVEELTAKAERRVVSGKELGSSGIDVSLPKRYDARVYVVRPKN